LHGADESAAEKAGGTGFKENQKPADDRQQKQTP
jgi:hypothetical protein